MTVSAILFAGMAVLVRIAGYHKLPGAEVTFARFSFGLVVIVAMHFFGLIRLRIRRPGLLTARGLTGGTAILLYFMAIASATGSGKTTLTNSVLLGNMYFVFAPVFAAILIREKMRISTTLAIVVALVGVYFVIDPKFGAVSRGDVWALASAVVAGIAFVTVRELRKTESSAVVFFSLCLVGTVIAAVLVAVEGVVLPDKMGWGVLLSMAVVATAAQLLQTYSLRFIPAGEGTLLAMTAVAYSAIAGVFLFREPFAAHVAIGAAMVLGSAAYLGTRQTPEL